MNNAVHAPKLAVFPLLLVVLGSCSPGSVPVVTCNRQGGVSFSQIDSELNKVWDNCPPTEQACPGSQIPGNHQVVEFGSNPPDHPPAWTGSATTVFSVSMQDNVISQARALAKGKTPPNRFLDDVEFFTVSTGGPPGTMSYIGFNARYGECVNQPH